MKSVWNIAIFFLQFIVELNAQSLGPDSKSRLLVPISYRFVFDFDIKVAEMQFKYNLMTEIEFRLLKDVDELVLKSTVPDMTLNSLFNIHDTDMYSDIIGDRDEPYVIFSHANKTNLFKRGIYLLTASLKNEITSKNRRGIQYSLYTDTKTKKLSYSIFMDFWPSEAKHVTLALNDMNTVCKISVTARHQQGFNVYFIKQAKFIYHENQATVSLMYPTRIPLGWFIMYVTQNLRLTKWYCSTSATVTAGRNEIGKFSEDYEYIVRLFYKYVKKYSKVWSQNLTFVNQDFFMHLHQNHTFGNDKISTRQAKCYVSMQYVQMFNMNVDEINYLMTRCIAVMHLTTRRYPAYWDIFYIQIGLLEYYTIMWQENSPTRETMKYAEFGERSSWALNKDHMEGASAILGQYTKDQNRYHNINRRKALCFMFMLKNLIVRDRDRVFDEVVGLFMADKRVIFTREDFIEAYQNVTENQVFSNKERITKFFVTWTTRPGFPIVTVQRHGRTLHLSQSSRKGLGTTEPFIIPVSCIVDPTAHRDRDRTHPNFWMTTNVTSYELNGPFRWYLINNKRTGYYRVKYDDWNYKLLRFELLRGDVNKIHPMTRGQLLDDSLFLARFHFLSYVTVFELLEYLRTEENEVPWRVASQELRQLLVNLQLTKPFKKFLLHMQMLSRKFYRKQVEEANELTKEAIRFACVSEMPQCRKLTYDLFMGFLLKRKTVENLDMIICQGVKSVDTETYNYIKLSLFNAAKGKQQDLYLTALVCVDNPSFLTESLNLIFRRTSEISGWLTPGEKADKIQLMFQDSERGVTALMDFIYMHPLLVLQNLGEEAMVDLMTKLSNSLYKRAHKRKMRAIIKYLKLKETDEIFRRIDLKRKWLTLHEVELVKSLSNDENVHIVYE